RGWLYRHDGGDLARATAYLDTAVAQFADVQRRSGGDATRVAFADQRYLLDVYDSWTLARIARSQREPAGPQRTAAAFAVLAAMERGRAAALVELVQRIHAAGGVQRRPAASAIPTDHDLELEGRALAAAALRSAREVVSFAATEDTLIVWRLTRGQYPAVTTVAVSRDTLTARVARLRRLLRVDAEDTTSSPPPTLASRLPRLEEGATR